MWLWKYQGAPLPVSNANGYPEFNVYEFSDIDSQRTRNRPNAQHLCDTLHDAPSEHTDEREREEHRERASEPKYSTASNVEPNAEDTANCDHLWLIRHKLKHQSTSGCAYKYVDPSKATSSAESAKLTLIAKEGSLRLTLPLYLDRVLSSTELELENTDPLLRTPLLGYRVPRFVL